MIGRIWCLLWLLLLISALNGCAGSAGPDVLDIPHDRYEQAFNTAVDVSRDHGMQAVVRDRREGLIETDPVITGTILEPWYQDTADFSQGVDNTLSQYRMKARFEFLPQGFVESTAGEPGAGPDLLGTSMPARDLTTSDEPLELRVWVYRERKHTIGQRRSTWTRRLKSTARHGRVDETWEDVPQSFWTPDSRDEAAEHRLLAEIADRMDLPPVERAAATPVRSE